MATALPWIAGAALVYSVMQQSQAANEARRRAEEGPQLTPEQKALYNSLVTQLAWMAGVDPTGWYLTEGGQTPGDIVPPPVPFQAISDEDIASLVSQLSRDLTGQTSTLMDKALGDLGKRGLAGSSLVDQANAFLASEANKQLSQARTTSELEAGKLTTDYGARALAMLQGLNTGNWEQSQAAWEALLNQLSAEQQGWGKLISSGLMLGLDSVLPAGTGGTSGGGLFNLFQ